MKELDDVIEIRDLGYNYQLEKQLSEIIKTKGQEYVENTSPVTIETITEPREIPAKATSLFYSDGDAPNRVVPAGTILIDGKYEISEEDLHKKYEQVTDEKGNPIPGKYIKKNIIMAAKNPFGKKIKDINGYGIVLHEYDADCYFMIDFGGKIKILSKEEFEKSYTVYGESNKIVSKDGDISEEISHQEYEETQETNDEVSQSTELLDEIEKIKSSKHFSEEYKNEMIANLYDEYNEQNPEKSGRHI